MYLEHNMKRIEKEFNAITGQETITERDETAAEKKEREAFIAKQAELTAEAQARETQRQVILDRLGLTSDEARLLLG
jgi:hypothetical protein